MQWRLGRAPPVNCKKMSIGIGRVDTTVQTKAREFAAQASSIVFVLSGLTAGGAERVISLLANHWVEQGRRVTVVAFDSPSSEPYFTTDPRVTVHQLGIKTGQNRKTLAALNVKKRIGALRAILRETSPDLIVSFLTKVNVVTLIAARGLGIPIIVSERNNPKRQGFGRIWTSLRDLLYPQASRLVVMTKTALGSYPRFGSLKAEVIPNPVVIPAAHKMSHTGRRIVATGRLVEQKGFDLLLSAFAKIANEFPDWTLVIRGEGPLRKTLEEQRHELGLDGRVSMPGVTVRPGEWVEEADVFVFSSRYEGWGNVLTEAMAGGVPVISFDCPFGPREQITDNENGLLVPSEDVDALANAMRRMLSDAHLRERLGNAGRISSQRFSVEAVMEIWDRVAAEAVRDQGRVKLG